MRALVTLAIVIACAAPAGFAQTRRAPARRPAPVAPPTKGPAVLQCPSVLGDGVRTKRIFCDVLTGRMPAEGVVIPIPLHTGPVTLTFDLHNRHTYSEELVKSNRAYRKYTATIGVLTTDNTLLTRAIIQGEFRQVTDLLDRVVGGAGPGGVKAVAPIGIESITVVVPAEEESVSILGEKLSVIRPDGTDNFSAPGRPIAVVSNVVLEYSSAPVPRTPAPARRR
jgi:hypothetical protein